MDATIDYEARDAGQNANWPNGAVTPSDRARNQPSMNNSPPPAQNDAGTTETDASTMTVDGDCGCSPELACFECYLEDARGLPAVVPASRSHVDWEAHR